MADAVRYDIAAGREVVRDIVRSAPRDALRVARAGAIAGRIATPVARAVADRCYDQAFGWIELALDDMARNADAAIGRLASGEAFDMSRWAELRKYRTRWDP